MNALVAALLLAQAPVQTAPGTPAPAEATWAGTAGLSLIALTGNSQNVTFGFGSALERKTTDWIYAAKLSAAYGESKDPQTGASNVSALNGAASLRGDRRFTPVVSVYLQAAVDTDHLKSIEWRPTGEGGVSALFIDRKEGDFQTASLRTDLGFRAGREYRFQYYPSPLDLPDATIAAPKVGAALRYAISRDVIFSDEAGLLLNLPDGIRALVTNVAKLSVKLTRRFSLGISYGISEDTAPPPGKQQLDTALAISLDVAI